MVLMATEGYLAELRFLATAGQGLVSVFDVDSVSVLRYAVVILQARLPLVGNK